MAISVSAVVSAVMSVVVSAVVSAVTDARGGELSTLERELHPPGGRGCVYGSVSGLMNLCPLGIFSGNYHQATRVPLPVPLGPS